MRDAGVDDGARPVSTTRRTSIPVGTPAKSSAGIVHSAFCATVISAIERVNSAAEEGEPAPTNPATAVTRPWRIHRGRWSRRSRNRPCRDWRLPHETREVESLRHLHRSHKPVRPAAADADAEVRAVAAHGGDDRRPPDTGRRIRDRLAHGHGDIEEELIIAAMKREALRQLAAFRRPRQQGAISRRNTLEQATLRWCSSSPIESPRATMA